MKEQFGERLRAARKSRNYTQVDLAKLVGVTSTTIARAERGEQALGWSALEKTAQVLGQAPAYFFSTVVPLAEPTPEPSLRAQLFDIICGFDEIRLRVLFDIAFRMAKNAKNDSSGSASSEVG